MAAEQGKDGKPILAFASEAEWEAWLDAEHATSDGVWLKFAKKGTGVETVVYAEALDVALCYGWIDSQVDRLDESFYLQKFTPRRARSKWSQINRDKIEALTRAGRMQPAGLARGRARQGRRALGRPRTRRRANIRCRTTCRRRSTRARRRGEFCEKLNRVEPYAILYRLQDAKRPETRAKRIEKFVGMLERGELY